MSGFLVAKTIGSEPFTPVASNLFNASAVTQLPGFWQRVGGAVVGGPEGDILPQLDPIDQRRLAHRFPYRHERMARIVGVSPEQLVLGDGGDLPAESNQRATREVLDG